MDKRMKNRLVLLNALLVAGLLMAAIGTALGAGNLLKFSGKQVSASVTGNEDGNQTITIREDGKVVKNVTLPEKEGYATTIKGSSDGQMVITQVPKEEIEKNCNQPGFHCETNEPGNGSVRTSGTSNESGNPEPVVSCFINGKQLDPKDCPKPK